MPSKLDAAWEKVKRFLWVMNRTREAVDAKALPHGYFKVRTYNAFITTMPVGWRWDAEQRPGYRPMKLEEFLIMHERKVYAKP